MRARIATIWDELSESLWLIPFLLTILAVGLALLTIQVDATLLAGRNADPFWTFGGGVEGARGVLSTIATGIITVTGVVFSVTIVALQLASSQFTPRVLRNFTADRGNQVVLGVFIGTFTYSLLVLRSIRSSSPDQTAFVPSLSITVAMILALISIGFLIFFIGHTARSIQAWAIVHRSTKDALRAVDKLFPESLGRPVPRHAAKVPAPTTPAAVVAAEKGGYLQNVGEDALSDLARKHHFTVKMEPHVGDFVLPGQSLATVWPEGAVDEEARRATCRAFVIGPSRTADQDVEFSIGQLVDMAVKALSPGVNDPTTARKCIDGLGEILVVMGNRAMPEVLRTDHDGRLLFIARRTTYDRAVALSFDEIRHFGTGNPSVAAHLLRVLGQIAMLVPPERRSALVRQGALVVAAARRQISLPTDLDEIKQAGHWLDDGSGRGTSHADGSVA